MMNHQKRLITGIIAVLLVATGTVTAVLIAVWTHSNDVVGLYSAQDGREIRLTKNGTLAIAALPSIAFAGRTPLQYWVSGNHIIVGSDKARSTAAFKIHADGRLVGWSTVWRKYRVEPHRPLSLVGTYTSVSGDGEVLALDRNGAVYITQPLPTGETISSGIWVAGQDNVTVSCPDANHKTVYSIQGGNLVCGSKKLERTSRRTIVPATY